MLAFVFVAVAILIVRSTAGYVNGGVILDQQAYPDRPDRFYSPRNWIPHLVLGMGFVILGIALKFMWDVRHPKTPSRD